MNPEARKLIEELETKMKEMVEENTSLKARMKELDSKLTIQTNEVTRLRDLVKNQNDSWVQQVNSLRSKLRATNVVLQMAISKDPDSHGDF
jgi:predicted nuclease with TOPRIM domain